MAGAARTSGLSGVRRHPSQHGHKTRWDLVQFTHKLPEWKNPQGSAIPIQYRDILKAGGKTDLEIAAVEDELEGVALMENLLGAH